MRILVTGATGKVGQACIAEILQSSNFENASIVALCHNRTLNPTDRIEVIKGSIANQKTVTEALEGITHVIHLATCKETPETVMDVTVKGLFWLLEGCKKSSTFEHFILVGGDASLGHFFYDLMFKIVTNFLKIVAVSRHLSGLKENYTLIKPSEIENKWFLKRKKADLHKPKLLYLGRYKKEKGVFSLINIFDSINFNFELNIVGLKKKITSPNDKVKLFNEVNSTKKIISFYDKCNIFVLPSYTEGAPKVIFESLARYRPIIVFEEIKHVKENFRGIFVCRRQTKDFTNKVRYIMKNYKYIIKEIKKNKIHTKKQFQNELSEFFNENFK